jgi:hypothetical protein
VLQAISNQIVAPGQSISVALNATDADGDPLTFSARVLSSTAAQAYQLKQQLGLLYSGSYYYNAHGYAEKWIASSSGTWYFILPSGDLYRWTGVKPLTIQAGNLIAWLGTGFYADPRLLWNAQPSSVPNVKLSIAGNQLTVQAPAGAAGSYQIQVSASDGSLASVRTFTVTVQSGNTAPQLGALASQSLLANRSQTITLNATDAQNNPITFSARILGTFASAPASLAVAGNQLTIHTSPTYVGSFDVQVTASDGALSSSAVMRVTVSASPVANRFSADFNGDGIKDTASYNTDGSWWISTYKADGSFVNQQWAKWSGPSNWGLIQVGDVNGDGKADLLGGYKDGTWWVSKSTGAGFTGQSLWATWEPSSNWTRGTGR